MLLLALLLASPTPQLPTDIPMPPGCSCLGVEQHDYDVLEARARNPSGKGAINEKMFGKRWTCRLEGKIPYNEWAGLLEKAGWDVFEHGDQSLYAQRAPGRFIVSTMSFAALDKSPPPDFLLPAPGAAPETTEADAPWLAALPGATPLERKQIDKGFVEMAHGPEGMVLHAPYLRLRWAVSVFTGAVEIETLYARALEQAGWQVLINNQGGVVVAHYSKEGHDLWVKVTPMGREYVIELGDVGAQEAQAKLAEALSKNGHVAVYGIYFDTGSPQLKAESEGALQKILALLQQAPALNLEIQGHTDNTGHSPGNQLLSEARAKSVQDWLTAHGVAAQRLAAKGYADSQPVADNKTPEGRALNRRVELARRE